MSSTHQQQCYTVQIQYNWRDSHCEYTAVILNFSEIILKTLSSAETMKRAGASDYSPLSWELR